MICIFALSTCDWHFAVLGHMAGCGAASETDTEVLKESSACPNGLVAEASAMLERIKFLMKRTLLLYINEFVAKTIFLLQYLSLRT